MKTILEKTIVEEVAKLCFTANIILPTDTIKSLKFHAKKERKQAKNIFDIYLKNATIAKKCKLPICQDTGIAILFVELGQNVCIKGDLYKAINKGIEKGYKENFLRSSIVNDPIFDRINTKNNTPAIIHLLLTKGEKLKITLLPKGAGSENMSVLKMLSPSSGIEGIKKVVLETIRSADANPCPPIIVGVGIGGDFEYCAYLAKKALARPLGEKNKDKRYANLELELLKKINKLKIGPQGLGGETTALAVHIEQSACHTASLPIAVNIGCHVHRHASVVL